MTLPFTDSDIAIVERETPMAPSLTASSITINSPNITIVFSALLPQGIKA